MTTLADIAQLIERSVQEQQQYRETSDERMDRLEEWVKAREVSGSEESPVASTEMGSEPMAPKDTEQNDADSDLDQRKGRGKRMDDDGDMPEEERMDDEDGERQLTRAESRRAARERQKASQSERYGSHNLKPEGMGRTLTDTPFSELRAGKLLRSAMSPNQSDKEGYPELELLGARGIHLERDQVVIPFDLMANGRHAVGVEKRLKEGWRQMPIHAPNLEERIDGQLKSRALTSSNNAGAIGVDLDVARSQMWLAEVSPIMAYINGVMGVNQQYQLWYGDTAPTGGEVAEGGGSTENNPSLTKVTRNPVAFHYPWSINGNLSVLDAVGLEERIANGVEQQLMPRFLRACLSGPNTAASFANNSNSFNGLLSSSIAATMFGAAADTSISDLDREDIMLAEGQLRKNNAVGEGPFWVFNTDIVNYAVDKRTGGSDSPVYLMSRDPDRFREGLVGGDIGGHGSRFVETNLLGVTQVNSKAFARTAVGVYLFGSQAVFILFGPGLEFRRLLPTDKTKTDYSLTLYGNFCFVNPLNGRELLQTIS